MTSATIGFYLVGGLVGCILLIGLCYWSVNFFIRQFTEHSYHQFRERINRESDIALQLFRERLCEQIVNQENRSDALARLYASLIDMLRFGRELTPNLVKGDVMVGQHKMAQLRDSCSTFSDTYHKQSLHLAEDFCHQVEGFLKEKDAALEGLEGLGYARRREDAENVQRDGEIKQKWAQFEDRVTAVMGLVKSEFRTKQSAPASIMMKWLSDSPEKGTKAGATAATGKPGPAVTTPAAAKSGLAGTSGSAGSSRR
ncbi:hypothetical protein L4X63_02850 [Geomonas sp. Red32]|uniref:hypothetical protein n=1 Tax=Geomonas sp. Red32 TaxID=2912856 RepID=UPI00202CB779|nr:hypothetical protein [Geomonas sp. Red32]MCM0080520.1 hypothetical protein [Geomonas sp. Red32]